MALKARASVSSSGSLSTSSGCDNPLITAFIEGSPDCLAAASASLRTAVFTLDGLVEQFASTSSNDRVSSRTDDPVTSDGGILDWVPGFGGCSSGRSTSGAPPAVTAAMPPDPPAVLAAD